MLEILSNVNARLFFPYVYFPTMDQRRAWLSELRKCKKNISTKYFQKLNRHSRAPIGVDPKRSNEWGRAFMYLTELVEYPFFLMECRACPHDLEMESTTRCQDCWFCRILMSFPSSSPALTLELENEPYNGPCSADSGTRHITVMGSPPKGLLQTIISSTQP
jgi:hypothetical protein